MVRLSLIKNKYNLDVDDIFPSYATRERRREKFFENLNRTGRFYPDQLNHLLETEADEELDLLMNHLSQGSKSRMQSKCLGRPLSRVCAHFGPNMKK